MKYEMRLSKVFRPLLALFGGTRSRSFVSLNEQGVRFKFGLFDESFSLDDLASAEPTDVPWYAGVGWKLGPGTVALLGSQAGNVRVTFREPKRVRFFGVPIRCRELYVSLEQPEAFASDLRARLAA
ncbi:MAG: hypothetical protein HYV09_16025 [Deltaproteobacteria bacterium]|nr:hypothetical protein [Deltaproteobacteria bacterium]